MSKSVILVAMVGFVAVVSACEARRDDLALGGSGTDLAGPLYVLAFP